MHDLVTLEQIPPALTTAEIDATMAYAEAEKSAATRAAYASDWRDFAAWCAGKGATALPAHPGIVGAYLSGLADSGRKSSTTAGGRLPSGIATSWPATSRRPTRRGSRRCFAASAGRSAPPGPGGACNP